MWAGVFLARDFGLSNAADEGRRPYRGGQPAWLNTSVFLAGGRSQTELASGRPSTVRVRVSTRTAGPTTDVRVDAYLLGPHVGMATPALALATLKAGPATVPPGPGSTAETDPRVLTCTSTESSCGRAWTPRAEQLPGGVGHVCLAANCYSARDGGPLPPDAPFAPDDPHQAQRNLLLLVAPRFRGTLLRFEVLPAPAARASSVELVALHPGALDAGERWLLGSHPAVTVVAGPGRRRRMVRGSDGRLCPIQSAQRPLGARLAVAGGRPGPHAVLPGPTGPWPAELLVPAPGADHPGTLHAVDIVLRDEGGRALAGMRVLALVTAPPT